MNAERKAALVPIMAGTRAGIEDYPMTAALIDLNAYQYAGTIDGALAGIQREAGLKEAAALARLERYRPSPSPPTMLRTGCSPGSIPGLKLVDPDGVVRDSAGNPVEKNARAGRGGRSRAREAALDGLAIGTLLTSGDLASVRAKIVQNLQIP